MFSPIFRNKGNFLRLVTFEYKRLNFMKLIYLKSALKADSFDVSFSIKIPFFRVSFTIEPGRSLLVRYQNCLIADELFI